MTVHSNGCGSVSQSKPLERTAHPGEVVPRMLTKGLFLAGWECSRGVSTFVRKSFGFHRSRMVILILEF